MYEIQNLYCENIKLCDLISFLETHKDDIQFYALIIHDKDIKSDNTLKKEPSQVKVKSI